MIMNNYTPIDDLVEEYKQQKSTSGQTISISKEGEPIEISQDYSKVDLEPPEDEPIIEDEDVKEYLKTTPRKIELDPQLKKAGLSSVDHSSLDPRHKVKLLISDEKIIQGLNQPVTSSWRWLAELSRFLLRRAHLTIKVIHGHIVRVISH